MKLRNAVASALMLTAVTGCDLLIGPAWGPVPPEDYTDTNGTVIPCEWQSVQMPDTYATSAEGVQEIFTVDEPTGVHAPLGLYVYVSKVADDEWAAYPGGWVTPVWGCAHAHGKVS